MNDREHPLRLVDQEDRDRCREVCGCKGCTEGPYDPTHGLLDLERQIREAFGVPHDMIRKHGKPPAPHLPSPSE